MVFFITGMDGFDKNALEVKRFIELQIRPGEKYNYDVIQDRFKNALEKKENTNLKSFGFVLEKINKSYNFIKQGKQTTVTDWYVEKLREFIVKYRQVHLRKDIVKSNQKAFPVTYRHGVRFISGIPVRGNYYQEAATDEFGCVIVCD